MSISIDKVYRAVQSLVNKDQRSSLKPSEFNSFSHIAMTDILEDARKTVMGDRIGMFTGTVNSDRLKYSKEALDYFYVPALVTSKVGEIYPRPADIESLDNLFFGDIIIEQLDSYYHLTLLRKLGRHLSPDTEESNISYYFLPTKEGYQVYPELFEEDIVVAYHRKWSTPKWTYTVVMNTPVFNASASDLQDFELPERFFDDVVMRVALLAGVNLKDMTILSPLMTINQQEEKENTN